MTIPIVCPGCAISFDVPEELVGKTIRCSDCGTKVKVTDQCEGVADEAADDAVETVAETPKAKAKIAARDDDDEKPAVKSAKKAGVVAAAFAAAPKEAPAKKRRPADDDDDDRPKSKKKGGNGAMIAIVAGVVVLLGAAAGLGFWLLGDKKKDSAGNSSTPTTEAGWQTINVGTEFSCQLPPDYTPLNVDNAAQMNNLGFKMATYQSPSKQLFLVVVTPSLEGIHQAMAQQLLDEMVGDEEKDTGGKGFGRRSSGSKSQITGKSDFQVGGFPGKELQFIETQGNEKFAGTRRFVVTSQSIVTYGIHAENYDSMKSQAQRIYNTVNITAPPFKSAPTPQVAMNRPPRTNPTTGTKKPNPTTTVPTTTVATNNPPMNPMGTTTAPPAIPIVESKPMPGVDPMPPIGPNPQPMPPQPAGNEVAGKLAAGLTNPFNAGAFDTEKKELVVVGFRRAGNRQAGTIQRYSYPDFKQQGTTVNIPSTATRAAIDSQKGLLYVTTVGAGIDPNPVQFDRPAFIGDIAVYDLAQLRSGKFDEKTELKPVATISIGATKNAIRDISLSGDGKSLFVMTSTQTGKLVSQVLRIDTAERKIGKSVILPNPGWDMLPSPDGKKLFVTANMPAGAASPLMIVDANAMTLVTPSFALAKPAYNLAIAKDGRIIASSLSAPITAGGAGVGGAGFGGPPIGGPPIGGNPFGGPPMGGVFGGPVGGAGVPQAEITVLDPSGSKVESMRQVGTGVSNNGYIAVSPDGKYFVCSSQHPTIQGTGLDVYETSDKYVGDKHVAGMKKAGDSHLGGAFLISPDSDYVVLLNGAVLKLDDLNGGPAAIGGPPPVGMPGGFGPPPGMGSPGGLAPPPGGFPFPPKN